MTLSERFNQARMEKCVAVYQQIIDHWMTSKRFDLRVEADESPERKTLEELGGMYLDLGAGGQLTALPFLDMLIVVKMVVDHNQQRAALQKELKESGEATQRLSVKTEFTEEEAFALLRDVAQKIGIRVRNTPR
jgi:hypothetical protein